MNNNTWEKIKKYRKMYTWPVSAIIGQEYESQESRISPQKRKKNGKRNKCS